MKRLLPLIILLIMALMLMVSWSNIADAKTEVTEKYKSLMAAGERFEEKKIYIDAVKQYEAALKLKPEYSLALHVASLYDELDDEKGYLNALDTAISCDAGNPEPYMMKIARYQETFDKTNLYKTLNTTKAVLKDSDRATEDQRRYVDNELKKLLSEITVSVFQYDEQFGFHRYEGKGASYAKVRREDKYGIIDSKLGSYASAKFDDISLAGGGLIPVLEEGEYYYIDTAGNRKVVTDEPATAIGVFGAGYAPVQIDGKYGYIDSKMREYHFEYEYAGSFECGIAPVQQNGKWFVINKQFQPVGPNFDEILIDNYGFCSPYGVYFGRSGSSWGMYSTAGQKIADGFEDVRQFASNQPAAIKKGGKWGYISLSGEEILAPQFEDAKSFSIGYAPVLKNGLWGCINQEGQMLVDPQFKNLEPFNEEGLAFGENAEGLCTVVIRQYK